MTEETKRLKEMGSPLLSWFAGNARKLPWRDDPTAYHVWVSEIMLQQTRVEAVKPFYARFIGTLPDVKALAGCPEDQLLKLWEGLGYYNRVRNMQKAAQIAVESYDGKMPTDYGTLLSLPGIGSYTAGAVASIAGGQAVPAVDGNVLRVISRICGSEADIAKQSVKRGMEETLLEVIPADAPGSFNQALMELGATVCLPNGAPECSRCPVLHLCMAGKNGSWDHIPVKAAKKPRRVEQRTVLVIRDSEHAAVRRRPKKGLLAGLYELPNTEGHLTQEQALKETASFGFSPIRIRPLEDAKHIFSHVEWQMKGYLVLVEEQEEAGGGILFVEPERTERDYPIPAAFAAYAKYLKIRLGQEKYKDKG